MVRRRKEPCVLFLWWLFFFIGVYSFVIVYRQKNVLWILPALAAVTALGVEGVARVLKWWSWETFPMKKAVALLSVFFFATTALAGGRIVLHELPKKNFHDGGAYMGHLELYDKICKAGADKRSLVLFTLPQMQVGARMIRLFLEKRAAVAFLSQFDVNFPPKTEVWQEFEARQLRRGRSLYYCFLKFDNLCGNVYITDETFRTVFEKLHPDIEPEIVLGLDGQPLWHLYVVRAPAGAYDEEVASEPSEAQVSTADLIAAKAFKVLARGFLMVADFDKLKKKGIKKINKMSETKWEKRSQKVKDVLKDLPAEVREAYGFRDDMTREDVLKSIKAFDKKKATALLRAVPDRLIAAKIRAYRRRSSRDESDKGPIDQVKSLWQRALAKWNKEK